MDQKLCRKRSQDGLEIQTCEKLLHRSDKGNIKKRPSGEIPTSSENESNNGQVLMSQSCSEQMKNECSDSLQGIKEEKTEVSIKQEPETTIEHFLNSACDSKVEADVERVCAETENRVNLVTATHSARPGESFTIAKSAKEPCSEENVENYQTEQHFNLKQEPSCKELITLPNLKEKNNTDKAIGIGQSQKTFHIGV